MGQRDTFKTNCQCCISIKLLCAPKLGSSLVTFFASSIGAVDGCANMLFAISTPCDQVQPSLVQSRDVVRRRIAKVSFGSWCRIVAHPPGASIDLTRLQSGFGANSIAYSRDTREGAPIVLMMLLHVLGC